MLVKRLAPPGSKTYEQLQNYFIKYGNYIEKNGWIQLFFIWTLVVAGIVVSMDFGNRYIYWEWNGWGLGLLKLFIVTLLYLFFLGPNEIWNPGMKVLSFKDILRHTLVATFLLFIGWFDTNGKFIQDGLNASQVDGNTYITMSIITLMSYLLPFISFLLIFQLILELDKDRGVWVNQNWQFKLQYLSISLILILLGTLIGIKLDDPILCTAGAVSAPFSAIALLWPDHVRHLQRARFYPTFIFAMFLSVRAPWFLIPLALLFFTIRTVKYFQYGIIYPSFGVDFTEED